MIPRFFFFFYFNSKLPSIQRFSFLFFSLSLSCPPAIDQNMEEYWNARLEEGLYDDDLIET